MLFAALSLCARATHDTARGQINIIPSKTHVIPLFLLMNFIMHINYAN